MNDFASFAERMEGHAFELNDTRLRWHWLELAANLGADTQELSYKAVEMAQEGVEDGANINVYEVLKTYGKRDAMILA